MPGDTLCIIDTIVTYCLGVALLTGRLSLCEIALKGSGEGRMCITWGKTDAVEPGDILFTGQELDHLSTSHRYPPVLPVF